MLAHLEVRFQIEGEGGDDTECAEGGHGAVEARVAAADRDGRAVRRDDLDLAHGGGEGAVRDARAVGAGRHRARHGDVREGGHVVQGEPVLVHPAGQFGVPDAARDPYRTGRRVDVHGRGQRGEREKDAVVAGLGDLVERVPAAQHAHLRALRDQRRERVEGVRAVQFLDGVRDVAGPVGQGSCHPCCPSPGSFRARPCGGHGWKLSRRAGRLPDRPRPWPPLARRHPR